MKKVLIISTSLRGRSNSRELAEAFEKGAKESGNDVELITLQHKDIKFCIGCLVCAKTGKCVQKDDVEEILKKIRDAEVVAFATPIYFYGMSGQMKTLLDRTCPLYQRDYKFTDIYLLTSAEDDNAATPSRAIAGLEGWIECYDRSHLAGTVFAGGVNKPGEVKGHPSVELAYNMGKSI